MIKFSKKEVNFIKRQTVSRVATISKKGLPQVTPVLHVFDGKNIYFATDYDTKKFKNIKLNPRMAFVVDVYKRSPQGITIQGKAEILERGSEFNQAYGRLEKRHEYYRKNPFEEGEAPIIKIIPLRKSRWGL